MLKKMMVMMLGVVMVSIFLVGCGNGDNGDNGENGENGEIEEGGDNGDNGGGADGDEIVELTFMVDVDANLVGLNAVFELAEEELGIRFTTEIRPGGLEGENLLRTRLASGDAADVHFFNSGALLQTLNPTEHFIDLSGQDFLERIDDTFLDGVTVNGGIFGIPARSGGAGAIFFNRAMYEEHGLEIPETWDEFMDNVRVLHEAGETAIVGPYADAWTTQIPFLADNYNVLQAEPNFAEEFEAGQARFAETPSALRGFEKTAEIAPYLNSDFMATPFEEAIYTMGAGEAGHLFMLTFALSNIYEVHGREAVENIGIFGVPGDSGERGLTTWLPETLYGNAASDHVDDILRFFEFFVSEETQAVFMEHQMPDGPLFITGLELPDEVLPAVREAIAYVEAGRTAPALEFMTPVKGPNLPSITQGVVSGQFSPLEGAEEADADAADQARQLGIDWD